MNSDNKSEVNYRVGQEIKHWRMKVGCSREELSEKIGISATYLANIETGKRNLSTSLLIRILNELEVSADILLFPDKHISNTDAIVGMLKYASPEVIRFMETMATLLKANFQPIDLHARDDTSEPTETK